MSDKPSERARALVGYVVDHFDSYYATTRHPSQTVSRFITEVRQELAEANHDRDIVGMTVVIAYEYAPKAEAATQAALPSGTDAA